MAELAIYRAIEKRIKAGAEYYWLESVHALQCEIVTIPERTVLDLLVDLAQRGWLQPEKYSAHGGKYLALAYWQDTSRFFYSGKDVRMRITIPGTRRQQALEIRELTKAESMSD